MTRVIDPVMKELRETLLLMGSRSEAILEKSIRSVSERNAQIAMQVADDDLEIDRLDLEVDDLVMRVLALQAPVANDLREVIAIKTMATDLERVGDLARNIAKSARRLASHREAMPLPATLTTLSRASQAALRRSLDAFGANDAEAARMVLAEDDSIDEKQDEVVRSMLRHLEAPGAASQEVDVILVAKNLERVGDHASNIAENVILVTEARNVKHAAKLARGGR